jgi:hypothetical protein
MKQWNFKIRQDVISLSRKRGEAMKFYLSIVVGCLISLGLHLIFEKFQIFFLIVPAIIVACNIEREKQLFVSLLIACVTDMMLLFSLLITDGFSMPELVASTVVQCVCNLAFAAALGWGYSKSQKKQN